MSKIREAIDDWNELEPKKKIFLVVLALSGATAIGVHHFVNANDKTEEDPAANYAAPDQSSGGATLPNQGVHFSVLPQTTRNQGLEDMNSRLDHIEGMFKQYMENGLPPSGRRSVNDPPPQAPTASEGDGSSASVNLDAPLDTDKVQFDEQKSNNSGKLNRGAINSAANTNDFATANNEPEAPAVPQMKIWPSEESSTPSKSTASDMPSVTIPVNSALEGVMLSGINARQPGASTGAAGSITSAQNVGAPFVTRLKGVALLPNGWKVSNLADCWIGGSAVAILSTERANAISDTISCIYSNGEIWEAPIKAYALDTDGTMGIAGKVVSKQGSILLQSALAGVASGLGTALAPAPLNSFNSNAVPGQVQGYQLPNGAMIAGTALGQGLSNASTQLSKFYLDYAREIFPVVEVSAGTRVTWILKESIELKKKDDGQKVSTK